MGGVRTGRTFRANDYSDRTAMFAAQRRAHGSRIACSLGSRRRRAMRRATTAVAVPSTASKRAGSGRLPPTTPPACPVDIRSRRDVLGSCTPSGLTCGRARSCARGRVIGVRYFARAASTAVISCEITVQAAVMLRNTRARFSSTSSAVFPYAKNESITCSPWPGSFGAAW